MTDAQRAELRRGIEWLVRSVGGGLAAKHGQRIQANGEIIGHVVRTGSYPPNAYDTLPPLTTFEQMCLSGLLGDPAQLREAVVDYLLDSGHEYATACYERGKADQREADHLASQLQWAELNRRFLQPQ